MTIPFRAARHKAKFEIECHRQSYSNFRTSGNRTYLLLTAAAAFFTAIRRCFGIIRILAFPFQEFFCNSAIDNVPRQNLVKRSFSRNVKIGIYAGLFKCRSPFFKIEKFVPAVKLTAALVRIQKHFSKTSVTSCKNALQYADIAFVVIIIYHT